MEEAERLCRAEYTMRDSLIQDFTDYEGRVSQAGTNIIKTVSPFLRESMELVQLHPKGTLKPLWACDHQMSMLQHINARDTASKTGDNWECRKPWSKSTNSLRYH